MESFFGKIYTGIKAAAALTNTGVSVVMFYFSGPAALPIVYATLTGFTWIDLFMHGRTARLAAAIGAETAKLSTQVAAQADQNTKLSVQVAAQADQNTKLAAEIDSLAAERDKIAATGVDLRQSVSELQTQLAAQVELSVQAKKFIATLVSTENDLKDVKDSLISSIDKAESVTETLRRITTQLESERFSSIDIDGDGKITPDELAMWSKRSKH